MLKIPLQLQNKYDRLLMISNISLSEYDGYKKWLRFYLDFCKKYQHAYADPESLMLFIEKLKEKKQTDLQRDQAKRAVELYYSGMEKPESCPEHIAAVDAVNEKVSSFGLNEETEPWPLAIESLKNEIQFLHYSKKTLKAYSLWAEKFRYFAGNKLPETLDPDDVKKFLTFLAVEKRVSASSQNQAFNALLFFFQTSSNRKWKAPPI